MLFVLLATSYINASVPDVYVLDYQLSGTDCVALLEQYTPLMAEHVVLSCEADNAEY